MTDDPASAIESLLDKAADAHHVYERDELHDSFDHAWPEWYAEYLVENGLNAVRGRQLTAAELGEILRSAWDEFRAIEPKPADSWAAWTARRIAFDL